MINQGAIAGINHVLTQQDWPRARLQPFAGRTVTVRLAPLPDLRLRIRDDGLLETPPAVPAESGTDLPAGLPADLTVTLKPAALPRLLQRDDSALRDIELIGAADLAQVVQQLLRELEWDLEEDLSRVFGDVLAQRMVRTGRDFIAWQKEAAQRLAQNLADYWTEEQPVLARKDEVSGFGAGATQAAERVDALEQRIAALERRRTR